MNIATDTGGPQGVAAQELHETVRQLAAGLGPTLVSLLANSKDQRASIRWARADLPEPRAETRARLLAAHRVWTLLVTSHNEYIARNWFIGANPRLDDDSPVERLRDGSTMAVLQAARAFVDGAGS